MDQLEKNLGQWLLKGLQEESIFEGGNKENRDMPLRSRSKGIDRKEFVVSTNLEGVVMPQKKGVLNEEGERLVALAKPILTQHIPL